MTALRGAVLLYTNGYALSVENTKVIAAMQTFESGRIDVGFVMLALGILFLACGVATLVQAQKRSIVVRPAVAALAVTGVCLLAVSWTTNLQLMLPKPVL
ncbi:hypothetical protein [Rhizobium leguminosarum]|uniref:hypothetical protein n=1 Tax=Rhizobium leguminosarum TaxID=384 RepID=UPI001FE1D6D3|nr:hypothetical protein [Rhizobium leguminosarum]